MRLLSLSESDKDNLRLLELLVHKDPGAVARLLQTANNAFYGLGCSRPAGSTSEAMQRLGSETSVCVLMNLWALESVPVPPENVDARAWLSRHTFSLCATLRRVLQYGNMSDDVSFLELQLTALVDKLALATVLSSQERSSGEQAQFIQESQRNNQALHQVVELSGLFGRAQEIARAWDLGPRILANLEDLQNWRTRRFNLGVVAQAILLGELLLGTTAIDEGPHGHVLEEIYESSSLMHRLVERRVDPATLAIRL